MLLQIYTQHRRCVPRRYVADQPEPVVLETESSFQEMLKVQAAVAQHFKAKVEVPHSAFLPLWDVLGITHGSPKREQR